MGKLFSLLSVQNAIVQCLTDYTIKVAMAVSQRLYLILDVSNSLSGFFASVAEAVYLAEGLVRTV